MPNLLTRRRILRPFRPDQVPGLALWLDAADSSTITLDGSSNVSQWNDKSGNGKHAVQSTFANRPIYTANALGGQNALVFDGSNDCLQIPSLALPSSITIFLAFRQTSDKGGWFFMEHSADANANDGFFLYASAPQFNIRRSTTNNNASLSAFPGITNPTVATTISDTSIAANGQIMRIWYNGTLWPVSSYGGTGTTVAESTVTTTLNIGARNNGAATQFNGALGELLIYSNPLSMNARLNIEAYLRLKWGTG